MPAVLRGGISLQGGSACRFCGGGDFCGRECLPFQRRRECLRDGSCCFRGGVSAAGRFRGGVSAAGRFRGGGVLRHGVVAAATPGMAAREALQGEPRPLQRPVLAQRLKGVLRAGGDEAARRRQQRGRCRSGRSAPGESAAAPKSRLHALHDRLQNPADGMRDGFVGENLLRRIDQRHIQIYRPARLQKLLLQAVGLLVRRRSRLRRLARLWNFLGTEKSTSTERSLSASANHR